MIRQHDVSPRATPIVIIGMNRSGTKWLSNMLGGHANVSAIQSEHHCGQIETNLLCIFARKFDLSRIDDYIAAVELWSQTDFFRVAGVNKEIILCADPRPTHMADLLRLLFDEVTLRDGTSHFLLKTGPTQAVSVLKRWPDARAIVIERPFHETLTSTLQLAANKQQRPSIFEATYSYVAQKKVLDSVRRQHDPLYIRYADLHDDTEQVLRQACDYVGLAFTPSMLECKFARNTSFDRTVHPSVKWTIAHPLPVSALRAVLNLIPLSVMQIYSRLKSALADAPPEPFIRGSFSMRQAELGSIDPIEPAGVLVRSGSD